MRAIAVWLILLGATSLAEAQASPDDSYFARAWTAEDGLPENKVIGVAQSTDGYLWVATLGGLVRFDGVRFQPFETASAAGYVTSTMRVLQEDRAGRLWLAKEGGAVLCINGAQVQAWTAKDGLPQFEGARSIAEDNDGGIWISYTKGTVVRLKNSHVDFFAAKDGLPANGVCWLATDRNGQLWFAKNGHVGVWRDGKFVTLLNMAPHYVRIAPAKAGGVWICSGVQVYKFVEGGEPVPWGQIASARPGIELAALLEDREGALWIGTAADGLFRCDSNSVTSVETTYHAITSLAEDREGNIWAGTRGGGLNRLQRRVISLSGPAAGLPFEAVQSLCRDASGALWAVGQNNVLVRCEEGRWTTYPLSESAPTTHAICVTADSRGKVWVGSDRGSIYEWIGTDNQFKKLDLTDTIQHNSIRSMFSTASGDLWIATDTASTATNALYRLRNGSIQKFGLPAGYRFIRAMAEDAAGNFWAGGSDGLLVRVSGDVLSDETATSQRLSIRCLYGTPDGSLWIGYAGAGAGRLRNGRFTRFGADQGMPNDYVSQILGDGQGGIWFAGNQGIFMVREHEFDDVAEGRATHVQPVLYGRSEGLPNLQANFDYCPNSVHSKDGHLYFSMVTGVAEVQPDQRRPNHFPPVVLIERVTADDRTFAVYQDGKISAGSNSPAPVELKDSTLEHQVELPPGIQQLTVEFSALSFVAPENVQFRYQLGGFDRSWVEAGTRRVVQYTHVPPGKYHFKVVASNNDGLWNDTGATLDIALRPHLWETFWFKALMTAAVFGGLCGVVVLVLRRRHRLQIRRLEEQRSLERERTRIARDLHDDLGVGLTEIGLLGDLAGAPTAAPEASREYSHEITGRARDLVGMLDEIVWAINPANDTAQSLSDYFFMFAQTLLHRALIRCRLEVVEPFPSYGLNAEQRHQLFLAFKEALNNIIRHSGATEVKVSLSVAEGQLRICLVDNGHGFKMTTDESSHDGLVGMEKRLQSLGGRCEIASTGANGTSVKLSIPIEEQAKP